LSQAKRLETGGRAVFSFANFYISDVFIGLYFSFHLNWKNVLKTLLDFRFVRSA